MALGLGEIAGVATGLIPSIFKLFSGSSQKRQANRINPIDPGYTMNQGVIQNANVLSNRAGNYTMPGFSGAVNNLGASTANAFNQGIQGATSGGDVLDLATKLAYGQQQQLNNLATQNAIGSDQALMQSLNANAQAGQEYVNKNAYDRDLYQQKLREKAALTQAGNENIYGGLDAAATVGTTLLNPRQSYGSGQQATPQQVAQQQAYLRVLQGDNNVNPYDVSNPFNTLPELGNNNQLDFQKQLERLRPVNNLRVSI